MASPSVLVVITNHLQKTQPFGFIQGVVFEKIAEEAKKKGYNVSITTLKRRLKSNYSELYKFPVLLLKVIDSLTGLNLEEESRRQIKDLPDNNLIAAA